MAAAAVAANDSAINSSAPFTVLQAAGVAPVTVNNPPKLNFAVFSDGRIKPDLTLANVRVAVAKLVLGTNGNPDQWTSYISRTEVATAGVGPGGVPALASAIQATTDGSMTVAELAAAGLAAQLVYNADAGYYTYSFKTDIKDPAKTNGVVFEPARTHRVAIQLSYQNAAGETVLVNPYIDFTIDAAGKSVLVVDPARTRKMSDVTSCNSCHEKLALHGGGRVDTQYCVMCHNPGSTDANSGNVLTLSTMVHKIHAGRLLKRKLDSGQGGEDYTIWGYRDTKASFAEVGFPQDLRNCSKCHTAANPNTPQGDNWKSRTSKEACLGCHASRAGSTWDNLHRVVATQYFGVAAPANSLPDQECSRCHGVGSIISPERVHWNQNEENGAKYKMNIEKVEFKDTPDHKGRSVTVAYFLSDPTHGDAAYNLVTPECTGTSTIACSSSTKFGNLRLYLAYQNMVGQSKLATEYSAYNNGGSSANAYAYKGRNNGANHYEIDIPIPDDSATAVLQGTARVLSIGQIKEPKLDVISAADPRPEVVPRVLVNTVVQHSSRELALTGALLPRRTIVSNDKCNACHGALGTTSGSNTLAEAFHGGARNTVEACVLCHDPNRVSSTVTTSGLVLNESYQFKRMIHGIHGNSRRSYPFTHGNTVVGSFNKDGSSATGGAPLAAGVLNYAAEVSWPGVGVNCNACHVNNAYKTDLGTLGSVVLKGTPTLSGSGFTVAVEADPNKWLVISPRAASCTACHDSSKAREHVATAGGSVFGERSQGQLLGLPRETCDDCHASGGFKSVDAVHGQK